MNKYFEYSPNLYNLVK